ncbi:AAA family ATPase [Verrucomicrobiota bacterium]
MGIFRNRGRCEKDGLAWYHLKFTCFDCMVSFQLWRAGQQREEMLKRINKIKGFAVFRTFSWSSALPEFRKYNAIYGWNYSGKTTLSRIMGCYEAGILHPDYSSATFEVQSDADSSYSEVNLSLPFQVRVFNTDFIKRNIKSQDDIEPIFLLGEENIALQAQLKKDRRAYDVEMQARQDDAGQKAKKKQDIEDAQTAKAREVKNTLSIPDFDKTKLAPHVSVVSKDASKYQLSDEQKGKHLTSYRTTAKKGALAELSLGPLDITEQLELIQALLKRKAISATPIDKLLSDDTLAEWVKTGKTLHQGKQLCEFCGNELPSDLLQKLNEHFSTDYEDLLSSANDLIDKLKKSKLSPSLHDKATFYDEFQAEYVKARNEFDQARDSFNAFLEKLIQALEAKKAKPFDASDSKELSYSTEELVRAKDEVNSITAKHNNKTDQFEEEKRKSADHLIKHFASEYILDEKPSEALKQVKALAKQIETHDAELKRIGQRISDAEARLSESVRGAEKVNEYLTSYFGNDHLRIEEVDGKKFRLLRHGHEAKNLSEGEETAISFAYFIARLEDKSTDLGETVVWIDDPVSSLDHNHLFHTHSLIKTKLANCRQLFLSTHNFEFFNLTKDWFKRIERPDKKNRTKWSCYLLELTNNASTPESCLRELPDLLLTFRSEYDYLFSILHAFKESPSVDFPQLFNLPNLLRRYLEAFLGFKIPRAAGFRKKLKELIHDDVSRDKVLKFTDHYSHQTSLPRSLHFPDLNECLAVLTIVFDALEKKDKEHFDVLVEEATKV